MPIICCVKYFYISYSFSSSECVTKWDAELHIYSNFAASSILGLSSLCPIKKIIYVKSLIWKSDSQGLVMIINRERLLPSRARPGQAVCTASFTSILMSSRVDMFIFISLLAVTRLDIFEQKSLLSSLNIIHF